MLKLEFNSSNFELGRPLPKGKSKEVIGSMNDELDGNTLKQFAALS